MTLLIIEDDAGVRELLKEQLQNEGGHETACVRSAGEALAYVDAHPPDLLLLDYGLPDMSGKAFLETFKKTGRTLPPFIVTTGQGDERIAVEMMKLGARDYIVKDAYFLEMLPGIIRRVEQEIHTERKLKQVEKELNDYRDHLEELVRERTAALHQEIEERKRTEIELQHAKEAALDALRAAEAANTLKSEFLANVSHDLRTPLNAVLGFAEILKERLHGLPEYHSFLDGIINGGRTLLHLINDLLDLSRIEAGRLEIRPETVKLSVVLPEIQQMFASKVSAKRLAFILDIRPDVPDTVLLDGSRLRQILMNLVGNAVKFTEKGSVTLGVTNGDNVKNNDSPRPSRGSEQASSEQASIVNLQFSIEDTGIGIPQHDLARMFEPFQQHDSLSLDGTGLGLAITKRLVEMMHGTIHVDSVVNEGTRFRVLLPATETPDGEREESDSRPEEQIHFHGSILLLVEDNVSNRDVVRAYLSSHNLRLIEAENGQKALQMLTPGDTGIPPIPRPDLILMDIRMPVMDGYEATQCLKANPELRTIPVVALTSYAVKEQREKYQTLYDAYLTKPISRYELIATLASFLSHAKTSPQEGAAPDEEMKDGIFEELNDYMAQAGECPQAFLDTLHTRLLPRHAEISEVMSADGMIAFAEAIITAGKTFTIPPLKQYGEELLRYITVFDIINIKRLLAQFPEIADVMTKP